MSAAVASSFLPARAVSRSAALILLAATLLALPLLLLLNLQGSERALVVAMRATLDPLAASVAVRRAVLQHELAAGDSLTAASGSADTTPEAIRRVWQAEVDGGTIELEQVLVRGRWDRAQLELAAMRDDWTRLVERIERRSIRGPESRDAHRLLVDQLHTVADLSTLRMAAQAGELPLRLQAGASRLGRSAGLAETETALVRARAGQAALTARIESLDRQQRLVAAALSGLALLVWIALLATRRTRVNAPAAQALADAEIEAGPRTDAAAAALDAFDARQAEPPTAPSPHSEAEALLMRLRGTDSPGSADAGTARGLTRDR